jgi:hypothetical protein
VVAQVVHRVRVLREDDESVATTEQGRHVGHEPLELRIAPEHAKIAQEVLDVGQLLAEPGPVVLGHRFRNVQVQIVLLHVVVGQSTGRHGLAAKEGAPPVETALERVERAGHRRADDGLQFGAARDRIHVLPRKLGAAQ